MSGYRISDGFRTRDIETVTTSTEYLGEQLDLLGDMYNTLMRSNKRLDATQQGQLDALVHWLTEILKQAELSDTVVLEVVE